MAIRGNTQIMPQTVTADRLAPNFSMPTSQLAEGAEFLRRDGGVPLTGDFNAGGKRLTNLAAPSGPADAATVAYVDAARAGLSVKDPVRVATAANINLNGTQLVDGVMVAAGDRVLVKNQAAGAQNGIYVAAAGAWARSADADAAAEVRGGMAVWVNEGTANADTRWVLTANDPITVGTTALTFAQDSAAAGINGGAGLVKNGNTLDLVALDASLDVQADGVAVRRSGASLAVDAGGLKVADPGAGKVLMGGAAGALTPTAISGDVSLAPDGVATVASAVRGKADWIEFETPGGAIDGARVAFTLAFAPHAGRVQVFLNGLLLRPTDYAVNGQTLTLAAAPQAGATPDWLAVSYFKV